MINSYPDVRAKLVRSARYICHAISDDHPDPCPGCIYNARMMLNELLDSLDADDMRMTIADFRQDIMSAGLNA